MFLPSKIRSLMELTAQGKTLQRCKPLVSVASLATTW